MACKYRCNWPWSFIFWLLVFSVFSITGKSTVLATQIRRKLHDEGSFISIDCGLSEESGYTDNKTQIHYTSDAEFIDTGTNKNISDKFISETLHRTFTKVRSFPEGKRNCYTLRPPEGKDTIYLIRAYFMYGNYDNLDRQPQFDLYVGVNSWDTVKFENATHVVMKEILHVPSMDDVYVCLLNTDMGTPFISALELRHFHNSSYRTQSGSLALYKRLDIGSTTNEIVRYNEDSYDRIWFPYNLPNCSVLMNTSFIVDSLKNTEYRLPSMVMRTALTPKNGTDSLELEFDTGDPTLEFYVYMHFAEVEKLKENEHREFNIKLNGNLWNESVVPQYLHSTTIYSKNSIRGTKLTFTLHKRSNSSLPPILNAMEIYIVKDFLHQPTDQEDVNAITDIKSSYRLGKLWQGDPCAPIHSWNELSCSYNGYDAPKIISLNLSSSGLTGKIILSFSKLKSMQYLDLSNNSLTGPLPEFFSQLPNLRTINLSGNRLSGAVPSILKEKKMNGSLSLSWDGNPDLCLQDPCKKEERNLLPVIAAIISSIFLLIIVSVVLIVIWRRRCKRMPAQQAVGSFEVILKSNNKQFTYPQLVNITNNFQKLIGKGGFGTVYHGCFSDGTQVAVKMLSLKSPQGSKQFQTEAQLLMRVHHRNLAAFLGYCNEGGCYAIIYEYMACGNLKDYLSDSRKDPLSWKQRIQIAIDAAQGLEYLHKGCKPPIIHRDIKTANILLNEKLQAKVADFGVSKFFPTENDSHISTAVVGTLGYLDPEYYISSRLNEKSDIYSFGIVLLELITGQPAIIRSHQNTHVVQWVSPFLAGGDIRHIVDPKLQGGFDIGSMWKAVEVAIACVPQVSVQRPDMSYVVTELKECLEMEAACEEIPGTDDNMLKSNSLLEMNILNLGTESGPEAR
ncbi:hypothetical protein L6164_021481 [Bauhinia variegata]|uniref:Uncharacterized protein n=1 Tax=Bauhinia variegata TaxID=167791 RepID=A0ACB9MYN2_BAUVA|nr:hypothetical protein L6164_021481 [Bauhinia variegata]